MCRARLAPESDRAEPWPASAHRGQRRRLHLRGPHGQLIGLGEYLAMYLFVWSDVLWPAGPATADFRRDRGVLRATALTASTEVQRPGEMLPTGERDREGVNKRDRAHLRLSADA